MIAKQIFGEKKFLKEKNKQRHIWTIIDLNKPRFIFGFFWFTQKRRYTPSFDSIGFETNFQAFDLDKELDHLKNAFETNFQAS